MNLNSLFKGTPRVESAHVWNLLASSAAVCTTVDGDFHWADLSCISTGFGLTGAFQIIPAIRDILRGQPVLHCATRAGKAIGNCLSGAGYGCMAGGQFAVGLGLAGMGYVTSLVSAARDALLPLAWATDAPDGTFTGETSSASSDYDDEDDSANTARVAMGLAEMSAGNTSAGYMLATMR